MGSSHRRLSIQNDPCELCDTITIKHRLCQSQFTNHINYLEGLQDIRMKNRTMSNIPPHKDWAQTTPFNIYCLKVKTYNYTSNSPCSISPCPEKPLFESERQKQQHSVSVKAIPKKYGRTSRGTWKNYSLQVSRKFSIDTM